MQISSNDSWKNIWILTKVCIKNMNFNKGFCKKLRISLKGHGKMRIFSKGWEKIQILTKDWKKEEKTQILSKNWTLFFFLLRITHTSISWIFGFIIFLGNIFFSLINFNLSGNKFKLLFLINNIKIILYVILLNYCF